jgi:hypothetical protein
MNTDAIAPLIQPEIEGEFNLIASNMKALIVLVVVPMVALLPDVLVLMTQKIFWPTPTDAVMLKQKRDPAYVFEGFNEVHVPPLPH